MALTRETWGTSAAIDLHGCAHDRLTDIALLRLFVEQLVQMLKMQPHGPCCVDRFGEGDLEGLSAMQFIKTSTITVHLDEVGNRAFIDIFSCGTFDPSVAEDFSRDFFHAQKSNVTVIAR